MPQPLTELLLHFTSHMSTPRESLKYQKSGKLSSYKRKLRVSCAVARGSSHSDERARTTTGPHRSGLSSEKGAGELDAVAPAPH